MNTPQSANPHTADARTFEHQVAGHGGIYSIGGGLIAKPNCETERIFYEQSVTFPEFQNFLAKFYGTLRLATSSERAMLENAQANEAIIQNPITLSNSEQDCICIEDISSGFRKPCILDIKLGTRLYDDDATSEKKARAIANAEKTTSGSSGIRICGLKVYDRISKEYIEYPREFGRKLQEDGLLDAISKFFPPTFDAQYRLDIMDGFLSELKEYLSVVENLELRLYSSSILFVYEGDPSGESPSNGEGDASDESDNEGHLFDFRVIDFAHSKWELGGGIDEQYLFGLRNTLELFEKLRDSLMQENL
ncbi:hypothetical protein K7432_002634 [Basidiobolus ranarum]|uniref:Kinase n=1 Tax=Basidiobolus ranarum TaxID=34480 RepID=A0ABR2X197_9FUNG